MPSAGFNIRLSATGVDTVRKALEQMGKGGESALKQIERGAKQANDNGLKAVNTGLREGQLQMQRYADRLGPVGSALSALGPAGLAAAAGVAAVGGAVGGLLAAVVSNAREFENLRARLQTVTGSAELAAVAFARLQEFAKTTPFELQNLITAFNRLKAAGIDPTEERLQAFGDTAAAFGKDITEFADAVVGALTGEGERLKQFGIIARFEADKVRFSFRGVTREVTRDAGEIVAALTELGQTNFAGGMEQQAKTLEGVSSNLADSWAAFLDTIDRTFGIADKTRAGLRLLTDAVSELDEGLKAFDPTSRENLLEARRKIIENDLTGLDFLSGERLGEAAGRALFTGEPSERQKRQLAEINKLLAEQARTREQTAVLAATQAQREAAAIQASKDAVVAEKAREEAAKAAERAAKELASERERALKQIATLEDQAAQAGLEGVELLAVKRDQELEAYGERRAKELGLEEEFAKARLAIEERFQKDKAEIEKDAADKARQEAEREAEKIADEARREAEKRERELEREAERQAEIMQRPFENALDGIQDSFTDAFERILSGGVDSFADLADTAKRIFTRLAAELATLQIFGGGFAGALGLGGTGSASAGLGTGGSGSFNFGSLLSGGGGLNSFLRPNPAMNIVGGGRAGGVGTPGVGGGFFNAGGFNLGGFLGGAGLGFGAGSLLNSLVGGQSTGGTIGSGIGSLGGAALGSFIPVIGPLLGGLAGGALGGLLGGLFGPGASVGPNANADLLVRGGQFTVGASRADNGGDRSGAATFAGAVAQQVNAVLQQLGAEFTGFGDDLLVGSFGDQFRVGRNYNGGRLDRALGTDPQAAANAATLFAFEDARLNGISPALEEAVRKAARISDDLEDFAANIGVAQAILDESIFDTEDLTAAEQALKSLNEQFEEASKRAKALGLDIGKLDQLRDQAIADLTEGFDKGISQQILALTDPLAAALANQAEVAEQRLKEAEVLGASLVEVERLNALERQKIIEQSGADLNRFFEEITFGGLSGISPGGSVEAQRAAFEAAAAQGNTAEISRIGRGLLDSARGAYASGPQYQEILGRVQEVVGGYVAGNGFDNLLAAQGEVANLNAQSLNVLTAIYEEMAALRQENARLASLIEARTA